MLLLLHLSLLISLYSLRITQFSHITFIILRVPHLINFVVIEDEAWLRNHVRSKLPDLIHTNGLLKLEVDRVLLIVCH